MTTRLVDWRRTRAGGASLMLVAAGALLMACSPAGDAVVDSTATPSVLPPPPLGVIPAMDSVRGLTLPSEAYYPTPAQRSVVDTAIDTVIAQCVSQFGFTWQIRPAISEPFFQMTRMYGIGDMERAQRYGYHFLPEENGDPDALSARDDAANAPRVPVGPEFELVLLGEGDSGTYQGKEIPAGGCIGQAHREVTGSDAIDPTMLAEEIGGAAYLASKSDSRVVDVVAAWSTCMREDGYDFPSPHDAPTAWDPISGTASTEEIQTAVADMTCKQQTNLIGVWYTIQSGYEDQLIQQNVARLNEITDAWEDAARRATEILGGSGTQ